MLPSAVSVRAWSPMSSASRHSSWISSPGRTVTAGSRSRFQRLCMTRLKPSSTRSPRGATTASGVPEPVTSADPSPSASASAVKASAASTPTPAWTCSASLGVPEWAKHMLASSVTAPTMASARAGSRP